MRIVGIILAIGIILAFAAGFGILSQRVLDGVSPEVALGLITFFGTAWLGIWSFNRTKEKEAESRLFSERIVIYEQLVNVIKNATFATRGWYEPQTEDEIAREIADIRFRMIAWGGQRTIRAIADFETRSATGQIGDTFLAASNLYAAIRADLGHKDDEGFADEIVLTQITTEEREVARAAISEARSR